MPKQVELLLQSDYSSKVLLVLLLSLIPWIVAVSYCLQNKVKNMQLISHYNLHYTFFPNKFHTVFPKSLDSNQIAFLIFPTTKPQIFISLQHFSQYSIFYVQKIVLVYCLPKFFWRQDLVKDLLPENTYPECSSDHSVSQSFYSGCSLYHLFYLCHLGQF